MDSTNRDYLTGLYTRQELYRLYQNLKTGSCFHFMFLDIDNFKNVNDVYGHNTGDLLLKSVARILKDSAPDSYVIRLGGDEFVMFFMESRSREHLCQVAENIINRITAKEGFSHIATYISASVGILYNETVDGSLDDILLKSDMAMYYAKSHGKGQYIVFNDIAKSVFSEIEMEKRQVTALENGEFEIRYLPVISAQTSRLRLSQARLFWNMPDNTVKSQEEFLPLFEKNGFIRQLDNWLIATVFSHLELYHQASEHIGKIGLRISRLSLLDTKLPDMLISLMYKHQVEACEIDFEVDETAFTRGSQELIKAMQKLKELGFGISVIGVGSDFKSLIYWDKLKLDSIIFDAKYLKNTLSTGRGRQIIKTLLTMGRELKMMVMADGIKSKEDALFLGGCGCNAISGPYYSAPLALNQYHDYVKDRINYNDEKTEFHFQGNLCSSDYALSGKIIGNNIQFKDGISKNWGSLLFPGGDFGENVVELPPAALAEPSFTVCMWLKPTKSNSWTSAFYARYKSTFCSFSPYVIGGHNVYRISEDSDANGFHDILSRQLHENAWTFVCITYDDAAAISRIYINGRKAGYCSDLPTLPACRQILLGGDPFQPSYEGYLSGLIFYNYIKSEDEIAELYQSFCNEPGFTGAKEDFWLDGDL